MNKSLLQEKLHVSALLTLISSRPPRSRTLEFDLIAGKTNLPVSEVEYLVMKTLALGLICGTIDQVDQVVRITWIQGRVLDAKGIQEMKECLERWSQGVSALEGWVHQAGQGVWVT
jgi:26S proteasome regulatory subunit N9